MFRAAGRFHNAGAVAHTGPYAGGDAVGSTDGLGIGHRGGAAPGALTYGLLFAPIALPCSGPFLVGIFAFSLTIGDVADPVLFFLAFGIGFELPLFVLGLLGQARGRDLARLLVRYERPLQIAIGVALIAVGLWDLGTNLPALLDGLG